MCWAVWWWLSASLPSPRWMSIRLPKRSRGSRWNLPDFGIRHYAPRARVVLVESEGELKQVLERETRNHQVGVLLPKEWSLPAVA